MFLLRPPAFNSDEPRRTSGGIHTCKSHAKGRGAISNRGQRPRLSARSSSSSQPASSDQTRIELLPGPRLTRPKTSRRVVERLPCCVAVAGAGGSGSGLDGATSGRAGSAKFNVLVSFPLCGNVAICKEAHDDERGVCRSRASALVGQDDSLSLVLPAQHSHMHWPPLLPIYFCPP